MDTGIIILLIILFIGTLCVVFQRPLVDFLFRYCSLGSLLDKLNNAFLSRDEKECLKQEREFRNASPEELQIRLEQAAERLIHTHDVIKAIAEECGFKDEFYFSRIFKKYYHLSPKRYRQEFGSFS